MTGLWLMWQVVVDMWQVVVDVAVLYLFEGGV